MRILFLMKYFEVGGQEVVTSTLASKFLDHQHDVTIVSFNKPSETMLERLDKRIIFYTLHNFVNSKKNVIALQKILLEKNIDTVINQWGLPYIAIKVLKSASKELNLKIISVYHNTPDVNSRTQNIEISLRKTKNIIKQKYLLLKLYLYREITSRSMRYVYNKSDIYILLSQSFIEKFQRVTRLKDISKLAVLPNPVTINSTNYIYNPIKKEKEILYVGRIDYNQKRVYRIIETWALLEKKYPNWKLTIVGDGPERESIECLINKLSLQNIKIEGFQDPRKYYERASILLLTSEYEGFPLVIVEAMCFGVVPIVYGSYSAVYDIITPNVNGHILPYLKDGFKTEEMAKAIAIFTEEPDLLQNFGRNAILSCKKFEIDSIYEHWLKIFNQLSVQI